MDEFRIWDAVSMAWTEIGLADSDYPKIATELRQHYDDWDDVNAVILGDVVASFAFESAFLPLICVPFVGMFLITPLPDWGYEESYLRRRMLRWKRVKRWQHFLNPIRVIGYPIAYLLSFALRRRLKFAFLRAVAQAA